MGFETGKLLIKIFLAFCEQVDVIELAGKFRSKIQARWVNRFQGLCRCVHQDRTRSFFNTHLFPGMSCHICSPFCLRAEWLLYMNSIAFCRLRVFARP